MSLKEKIELAAVVIGLAGLGYCTNIQVDLNKTYAPKSALVQRMEGYIPKINRDGIDRDIKKDISELVTNPQFNIEQEEYFSAREKAESRCKQHFPMILVSGGIFLLGFFSWTMIHPKSPKK